MNDCMNTTVLEKQGEARARIAQPLTGEALRRPKPRKIGDGVLQIESRQLAAG